MLPRNSLQILFLLSFLSVHAQPDERYNSSDILQSIKKLDVLGSVLYVAAHPDDENTRLITYYTKEKLYRTAYLSLTRGDGGQNLIGTELNDQLGLIRTQELLEARKVDGGMQFFSRADDFGFSKNPDETFQIWDKEKVLADVVWVIRKFKPDVIITRFNTEPGRTHGHHTASAILALEAFDAAADSTKFPEQLKYVSIWQAKRVLWNTNTWFYTNEKDFNLKKDSLLKVDVGAYNSILGKSYTEIAAESRSKHQSQGFGTSGTRGSTIEYLEHLKGKKAKQDLFENINWRFSRIAGGDPISAMRQKVVANFKPENPVASIDALLEIRKAINKLPDSFWKEEKTQEINDIIKRCLGFWAEATATDFSATPGEKIKVSLELINRSSLPIEIQKISFAPAIKDTSLNLILKDNIPFAQTTFLSLPEDLEVSQPYWLQKTGTKGMFNVDDQTLIGLPENPPVVMVNILTKIKGQDIEFTTPLVYKKTDPVKGEQYRPFVITPHLFINMQEDLLIFADNKPKTLTFNIKASTDNTSGKLTINVPDEWKAVPSSIPFTLKIKGAEQSFKVTIHPSATAMEKAITITAKIDRKSTKEHNLDSDKGIITLNYDHIQAQTIFPNAVVKVVKLDLKKRGENIGYIMGAGDEIPSALGQIGYKVFVMKEETITEETLKKFDAVIIGIRAFNTQERLKAIHPLLLKYVYNGGRLVAQYNTLPPRFIGGKLMTDSIGPYPFKLSNERVTVEEAEMRILNPQHPLLNSPNKITSKDFENWVQERGLYFPNEWDKKYETILSCNDPGETPKDGGILYTRHGKGVFIYTSLSWFRELPEGVPGAYRLFVNLISSEK